MVQDQKDETVRGSLPLFKLRSKADREAWRKLVMFDFCMSRICIYNLCAQAFPMSEDIKVGAEARSFV